MDEITEDGINKLLLSLPDGLNAIERMIMANEGTVQTFLSVLCNTPVKVEVISQRKYPGIIIRWAKLVIEDRRGVQTVICLAESVIHENQSKDLVAAIDERKKGIGQIIKEMGLETTRHIEGYHNDPETFARTYTIKGDCDMVITEVFNRGVIAKVSSGGSKERAGISGTCSVIGPIDLEDATEMLGVNPFDLMQQMKHSHKEGEKSEG